MSGVPSTWRARYAPVASGVDEASVRARSALKDEALVGLITDVGRKGVALNHLDICAALVEGALLWHVPRPVKGAFKPHVTESAWKGVCVARPARRWRDAGAAAHGTGSLTHGAHQLTRSHPPPAVTASPRTLRRTT